MDITTSVTNGLAFIQSKTTADDIHKIIDNLVAEDVDFQMTINVSSSSSQSKPVETPAELHTAEVKTTSPYEDVTVFLQQIGMPAHIKGYYLTREAILMGLEDRRLLEQVTKQLYPELAKKNQTTPSRVERAIRHAIEVAWSRGNVDMLESIFGYTVDSNKGRPTNTEFIALIVDKFSLKYKYQQSTVI